VPTLADLADAVGADAATYLLCRYPLNTSLDVDLDLWARQSGDNPAYDVQYAHARSASILRNASDLGLRPAEPGVFDPSLLRHPEESALLRRLAELPRVLATAAQRRQPHRVAHHLEDTASAFHRFQGTCRVLPVGEEEPSPSHAARLLLVDATRIVLANGLEVLGVSAPPRM
jgi:arginyl-tRNA synthetase